MEVLHSPFARKLTAYLALSPSEQNVLSDIHRRRRRFAAGGGMVRQGYPTRTAYILAEGWACSYILLPDGGRQIVDFQIPGDFLGLRSVLFAKSNQTIEPITAVEASEIMVSDLMSAFSATPRLFTAVMWAAARDESMLAEHLAGLGRRPSSIRMAHFLLELGTRLRLVGLADKTGYACPLTQYHLADALGLSAVHVNRVLRELREAGLVTFQNGRVVYDDLDELVAFADFDRDYLDDRGPQQHPQPAPRTAEIGSRHFERT